MKTIDNKRFVDVYLQCWTNAFFDTEMARAWHGAHDWTVEHMNRVLYPLAKTLGYCDRNCAHCGSAEKGKDTVCKPICPLYGTNLQQEYYKVDFSLYDSQGDDGWTLDYAIEHENAAFELNKLGIIPQGKPWTRALRAPLRPKGRGITPNLSTSHFCPCKQAKMLLE